MVRKIEKQPVLKIKWDITDPEKVRNHGWAMV